MKTNKWTGAQDEYELGAKNPNNENKIVKWKKKKKKKGASTLWV